MTDDPNTERMIKEAIKEAIEPLRKSINEQSKEIANLKKRLKSVETHPTHKFFGNTI